MDPKQTADPIVFHFGKIGLSNVARLMSLIVLPQSLYGHL